MKELVYQARRAHAGRKEPVRQQCDRARIVDRTRTPLRRSPRFLKPALLVDPPAPGSESGDLTSSEVAQEPTCSRHPSQPVFPFVGPQLQGNNDHVGGVGTMLVDPPLGHEGLVGMHHLYFDTLVLTPYSGKARNDRSGDLPPLLSLRLNVNVDGNGGGDGGTSPASGSGHRAAYVSLSSCRCSQRQDDAAAPSYGPPPSPAHELHMPARTTGPRRVLQGLLATVGLMPSPLSMIMHRLTYLSTPADRVAGAIDHLHVTPRASEPFPQDKSARLPPAPAPAVTHVRAGHARELLLSESLGRGLPSAFRTSGSSPHLRDSSLPPTA
ncbi:hypothetical protein C8R46DRAFT_1228021 [Mycena filopes]|nr:hypothetical protein C8R46DRAFT_1228021 [Mycena filopes]